MAQRLLGVLPPGVRCSRRACGFGVYAALRSLAAGEWRSWWSAPAHARSVADALRPDFEVLNDVVLNQVDVTIGVLVDALREAAR
ncbi:hypothetical protein [Cryptosporangium sp. NPDC051539]|uniref:hypothetical protein n=1 Tax=Cryptosporangium sp. NPDC051539 TaxID=3363962 RepID=UPI0037A358A5